MFTFQGKNYKTKSGLQSRLRAEVSKLVNNFNPETMRSGSRLLSTMRPEKAKELAYQAAVDAAAKTELRNFGKLGLTSYGWKILAKDYTEKATAFWNEKAAAAAERKAEQRKAAAQRAKPYQAAAKAVWNG